MTDRVQLEQAEARVLVPSFFHNVKVIGRPAATAWLARHIAKTQKFYGPGFDQRVRGYMRLIADGEML